MAFNADDMRWEFPYPYQTLDTQRVSSQDIMLRKDKADKWSSSVEVAKK